MFLIGLTGGIGSGKSTVSARLVARGAKLVDADAVMRELQQPGQPVFVAMVEAFGPNAVAADGTLDRAAIAAMVFGDDEKLKQLNAITHPPLGIEIMRRIESFRETDEVVVLDMPLLVESGAYTVDLVVVIDVDPDVAVERLVAHRGFTEADARARMARQATREQRREVADVVIDNSGSPDDLEPQLDELWERVIAR
jgi:dephospho-CoA kinase